MNSLYVLQEWQQYTLLHSYENMAAYIWSHHIESPSGILISQYVFIKMGFRLSFITCKRTAYILDNLYGSANHETSVIR